MKTQLLTILLLLCTIFSSQAQTTGTATAGKAVFFELGGPGIASFNYDTRFTKSNGGIGGRIGVGGLSIDGDGILTVPAGINYLVGKDNKHFFEMGAGFTYLYNSNNYYYDQNGNRVRYRYVGDEPFDNSFGNLTFGYRYQPPNGGFQFRAAMTPMFGTFGFFPLFAGISFGYKF